MPTRTVSCLNARVPVALAWMLSLLVVACGGDDDGGAAIDGGTGVIDGGAVTDAMIMADAEPVCPPKETNVEANTPCNPVEQTGCENGERCTQVVLQDEPYLAQTACAPDGTIEVGGECTSATAATETDDCVAGSYCTGGHCKEICSQSPETCCSSHACSSYNSTFDDVTSFDTGLCDEGCNPVTQNCQYDGDGCYLSLANLEGNATCSRVPAAAADRTQGDTCYGPDSATCFLNGCAEGYGALLFQGEGMARACAAFCAPVNTYLDDPDGNGEGVVAAGSDADGAAPQDCAEATIGAANHQCRFIQNFFVDAAQNPLSYVPAGYGFCVPVDDTYGDCEQSSIEIILQTFNDAGGGADGNAAIEQLCAEQPAKCASGCTSLEREDELVEAYCADNPGTPACPSAARRAIFRQLDSIHRRKLGAPQPSLSR